MGVLVPQAFGNYSAILELLLKDERDRSGNRLVLSIFTTIRTTFEWTGLPTMSIGR